MIGPLAHAWTALSMAGPALQKALLGAVPPVALGKAAGIYNVFRLLGGAMGTAVAVLVFTMVGDSATIVNNSTGFQAVMISTALLSMIGAGCAWPLVVAPKRVH